MLSIEDADAGIRSAAVQAVGAIGQDKQAADLVKLLQKTQNPGERADIEKALLAVSGRGGANCVQYLLPLAQSNDAALRIIALNALAVAGGPDALAAVKSALNDKDEAVQDEAVRTLSTWPNNWPGDAGVAEPLLTLAKSGKKMSHQVLGLRGYLQYVRADNKLSDNEKVAKVNELLPLIQRPEEKRLAIAAVGAIPTAGATGTADDARIGPGCRRGSVLRDRQPRGQEHARRFQRPASEGASDRGGEIEKRRHKEESSGGPEENLRTRLHYR